MLSRFIQTHSRATAAIIVALALAGLSCWFLSPGSHFGSALVHSSYDASQRLLPPVNLNDAPVAIVYLDLNSYLRERQSPLEPWDRTLHAQLVQRLTAAGAKVVVFDVIFEKADISSPADRQLTAALRANGRTVLAAEAGRSSRQTGDAETVNMLQLALPARSFLDAAAAWGIANEEVDDDFVVRHEFNGFADLAEPTLALAAVRFMAAAATNTPSQRWVRYYGKPLTIPHVSYSAALRPDEVRDSFFRNKIVFIGARPVAGTFLERKDEFRSPLSTWGDSDLFMPAVEVHATLALNLIRGDSLRRLSPATEALMVTLTAFLLAFTLFSVRPWPAAGMAAIGGFCVFGITAAALAVKSIWLPWLVIAAVQIPGALGGSVLWQSLEWYRQKRRFEAQQRASELKIREQAALIEKAQDAIIVENLAGRVIYTNPSAQQLYGWNSIEWQANGALKQVVAPCEQAYAGARETALKSGEWQGELEQATRDGRRLIVMSRCTLIRNERGEPTSLLFINTDATEKKRLEAEFYRAQRIESIGSLAGGMAHDLNNAFAPILMGLQLLQKQQADDETRRMLAVMEDNTRRGADMVRQVLMFSRGRDREQELISIGTLVREMERIVRQTFPKTINVAALVPLDLWPVLGNATQLHQVLLNLCVNARDAMASGGQLTLAADNVELGADEARQFPGAAPRRYVMLLVSDTGTGIPPEILPRIFEPFFTTKPAGLGTGLGLSTLSRIVRQHDGFVNLKSEMGSGTTFEIYLPAAAAQPVGETPRIISAGLPRGNGELILVVDDENAIREMVSIGLTSQGFRVATAANGADAVDIVERQASEVRLVLLDADMPVMNGAASLPLIRASAPAVPVIFMSGQLSPELRTGEISRLIKPFRIEQLLETIAGVLACGTSKPH